MVWGLKERPDSIFTDSAIFQYHKRRKLFTGMLNIFLIVIIVALVILYLLFLRDSNFILFKSIHVIYTHILSQIKAGSLLGVFYTTLVGGLFFVFMPLEVLFISFLKKGVSPLLLILVYLLGYLFSYTFNYFFGYKLSGISKKIISLQKFYKLKGVLNKWGAGAIFFFNALPLPSQPLAAILGVFRYNKSRFYFYFLLGEGIKYIAIIILFKLVL